MNPGELSKPLLLGTSNPGKSREIGVFANQLGFSVADLADPDLVPWGLPPAVPEVADSYAGNALLKARAYSRHFGRPCLADDTGLEIALLGDLPGIHTARWGLSRVIEEVGALRRVCSRFVCAMAYVEPCGRSIVTHGILEGELRDMVLPTTGSKPLPFGDFFYPTGFDQPLSLLVAQGFQGSHRFQALAGLMRVLS